MKRRQNPPWGTNLGAYKARLNNPSSYQRRSDGGSGCVDTFTKYGELQPEQIGRWACILPQIVGPRVLDVGCDGGLLTYWVYGCGLEVIGLDIVEYYINLNRSRLPQIEWICAAFEETEFYNEFDTIIMTEVLEHTIDPRVVMLRAHEALKASGRLVGTVPQPGKMHGRGCWYEEDEHLWDIGTEALRDLLSQNFQEVEVYPDRDNQFWAFKAVKGKEEK